MTERRYTDGEPCNHPGCLNHVTHPCEGCGRIAGQNGTERRYSEEEMATWLQEYQGNLSPKTSAIIRQLLGELREARGLLAERNIHKVGCNYLENCTCGLTAAMGEKG